MYPKGYWECLCIQKAPAPRQVMGSALKGHQKSLELTKLQQVFAEGTQGNQELPGVPGPSVVWEPPWVRLSHVAAAVL